MIKTNKIINAVVCSVLLLTICGENKAQSSSQSVFTAKTLHRDLAVEFLRCQGRENPLGIDLASPRLSWTVRSDQWGQYQTAYQIIVASTQEKLNADCGDLWDSGKIRSNETLGVEYQGKKLKSHQHCFWKVRVWDKNDQVSLWSGPASWSMGLLESSDWKARWVGLNQPACHAVPEKNRLADAQWVGVEGEGTVGDYAPGNRFFRRVFDISENRKATQIQVWFTGDDLATAYLNGERLGANDSFNAVVCYDGTKKLRVGRNVVGIRVKNTGDKPTPTGVIAYVRIDFEDGQPLEFITDTQWRCSKILDEKWFNVDFDDSGWGTARVIGAYGIEPWGQLKSSVSEHVRLPAPMLRKEFNAANPIRRATAYVCGLGWYELYINGGKVGDHVIAPAMTDFDKIVFYGTYDVTDAIKTGKNAVGIWLGSGRFFAPRIKRPVEYKHYGDPRAILQIRLEYQDGRIENIVTDDSWKVTMNGPIVSNNEFDGEDYDARKEMSGWAAAGFNDADWKPVGLVKAPQGKLVSQNIEPIRVTETLTPIAITNPQPGVYIFDMGQNMVGWCKLKVAGPAGTVIRLRHAETLDQAGLPFLENMRSALVTDTYTLKGGDKEVYQPRFSYHGFRYVEVTGWPGTPTLENLQGRVIHDDLRSAGSFSCSNPLLNQLYKNIRWGVRGNYHGFPTDCPQRDERQGWLGDRSAESQGEAYLFDISNLYGKWLDDIRRAQKPKGELPDIAPPFWTRYTDNVTWPSSFTIIPEWHYLFYGDASVIGRNYSAMKKWMTSLRKKHLKDNLMPCDQYGDWCVPPESPELIHSKDPSRITGKDVLGTTYYYKNLKLLESFATRLGKTRDAKDYARQAEAVKNAFNDKYYRPATFDYDNGTQTASVLPLAFGMVPDEHRQQVFDALVNKITVGTKGHLGTGLIGGQWLMRVLSDNGRPDVAYQLATNKDYPSWGYMVEHGATTIWELWNGDTADPGMNSHNHVMLVGDLLTWFVEYLAGIRPDPSDIAFKKIIICPTVVGDLTHAQASYRSVRGEIRSAWRKNGDSLELDVAIPANTTATIYVPAADLDKITESGQPAKTSPGLRFLKMENSKAVFAAESGTYNFVAY